MYRLRSFLDSVTPVLSPLRITVVYVAVSALWIGFSDRLVQSVATSPATITTLQTLKGLTFIAASGLLIYTLTARYSTAMEREQQKLQSTSEKLQVLNRVLRHNIRTQMNIIMGNAETVTDASPLDQETNECLDAIERTAERTVELAQKARQINTHEAGGRDPVTIEELVAHVVRELQTEYPSATIETDVRETLTVTESDTIELAVRELIENALEHNDLPEGDREVRVTVSSSTVSRVDIVVEDNGPGVPDRELHPLFEEAETSLEHGSALGLWMVKWAVDRLDGDLSFDTDLARGTRITMTAPRRSLTDAHRVLRDAIPGTGGR